MIVLQKTQNKLTVLAENPKVLLLDWLKTQDQYTKVKSIESSVNCFSDLAWVYGYFSVNREMMRVSKNGNPLCWIHHNFLLNLREQPIANSLNAESLFVEKLKNVIQEVLYFPFNPEL